MTDIQGGPATPGASVTGVTVQGGPARPVAYVTGRDVAGGPAQPLYVVSDAELASGAYARAGGPALPVTLVSDGRVLAGGPALPVYVVSGGGPPAPVYPAGMVARWTLDDTGAGYSDLIGGLPIIPVGTTTPTLAAGIIGNGVQLDGSNYIAVDPAPALLLQVGFAIEVWTYFDAIPSYNAIFGKGSSIVGEREYNLGALSDNSLYLELYTIDGNTQAGFGPAGSVALNQWTHIVFAIGVTQATVYVNGVVKITFAYTSLADESPRRLRFGSAQSTFNHYGRFDEPAIWQFGASGNPGAAFWLARYNSGLGRRP